MLLLQPPQGLLRAEARLLLLPLQTLAGLRRRSCSRKIKSINLAFEPAPRDSRLTRGRASTPNEEHSSPFASQHSHSSLISSWRRVTGTHERRKHMHASSRPRTPRRLASGSDPDEEWSSWGGVSAKHLHNAASVSTCTLRLLEACNSWQTAAAISSEWTSVSPWQRGDKAEAADDDLQHEFGTRVSAAEGISRFSTSNCEEEKTTPEQV